MDNPVSFERRGRIGIIMIDNPPVNALGHAVRVGLVAALEQALRDPQVEAIVLASAGRIFTAGADIREFGKPSQAPTLPEVIAAFDQSPKPVVAALHGTAFGGGLELPMGCHYRVALAGTKIGLPEVKLGLLPGAGGTQRLPRLAGVERALDMIVTGNPVEAKKPSNWVSSMPSMRNGQRAGCRARLHRKDRRGQCDGCACQQPQRKDRRHRPCRLRRSPRKACPGKAEPVLAAALCRRGRGGSDPALRRRSGPRARPVPGMHGRPRSVPA